MKNTFLSAQTAVMSSYINCPKFWLNKCKVLLFRQFARSAPNAMNMWMQHERARAGGVPAN